MKLKRTLSALIALVSIAACSTPRDITDNSLTPNSEISSVEEKQVVEIKLHDSSKELRNDLVDLSTKSFDLFGFNSKKKTIRARISLKQMEYLKSTSLSYKPYLEQNTAKGSGLMTGYSTADQMVSKMQSLAKQYPDIVSVSEIGKTWEKRSIYAFTITSKKSKDAKPASLFIGGMHARELAPPEIMFKLAETLASNYGKDQQITDIVNTRDVNIIPIVNVDGRVQVEKGNTWQRKNTHGPGVDLNRNFDSYWNYKGLNVPSSWVGDATNTGSETYSGTGPASEPEVQAVQNFYNVKKLNMVLDMHSYGEMAFYPVGYSEKDIPEINVFKNLYAQTNFKDIGYQIGTSMSLLYPTTATTDDYAYVKHHALGLGMEIGQSFRPQYSEVEDMWKKLRPSLLTLIKASNTALR